MAIHSKEVHPLFLENLLGSQPVFNSSIMISVQVPKSQWKSISEIFVVNILRKSGEADVLDKKHSLFPVVKEIE